MTIKELISNKVREDGKNYLPVNNCEKCKKMPEGKFCSQECYYRNRFDITGSYIKHSMSLAPDYFEIKEDKKEEFKDFLEDMIDTYY